MVKKILLTGIILAGLISPRMLNAPVLLIDTIKTPSSLEGRLDETFGDAHISHVKEYMRKMRILSEEKELLKSDKIYQLIDYSFYSNSDVEIPEYITKKFVRTVIKVESDDNPKAVSNKGARGLGQVMEDTWYKITKENYHKNVFIPEKNIKISIKHLVGIDKTCEILHPNWNKLTNEEKIDLISASYNGGCGKLKRENWKISKMFKETRDYVPKIHKTSEKFIPLAEIYEPISTRNY